LGDFQSRALCPDTDHQVSPIYFFPSDNQDGYYQEGDNQEVTLCHEGEYLQVVPSPSCCYQGDNQELLPNQDWEEQYRPPNYQPMLADYIQPLTQ